jgi:hypothetical protein
MKRFMLALLLVLAAPAWCQWTQVTASKIIDGRYPVNGSAYHLLGAGRICLTAVDDDGNPIGFQVGGGGQSMTEAFCSPVANGAIVGTFAVPDAALTAPVVDYKIEVSDNRTVIRRDFTSGGIVTGSTWSYDSYTPTVGNITTSKSVDALTVGALTVTGSCSGPGCGSGGGGGGTNGLNALATSATESAGSNCTYGGFKFQWGEDANANGVLDPGEVAGTKYACNGTPGAAGSNGTNGTNGTNGSNGANGLNALTATAVESAGANCTYGGFKFQWGQDTNANGVLDPGEVAGAKYACNGAPGAAGSNGTNGTNGTNGSNGANGLNALTATTAEPAGANCASGGFKFTSGTDTNSNGVLDPGEVTGTSYGCNGAAGSTGATGPAGPAPSGTPNQVVATDASGSATNPAALRALVNADIPATLTGKTVDGVTPTIFGYLDPTSSVQTQLDGKQAALTNPVTGPGSGATVHHMAGCANTACTVIEDEGAVPSGSAVNVNGSPAGNLNSTTPSADTGNTAATFKCDSSTPRNCIAELAIPSALANANITSYTGSGTSYTSMLGCYNQDFNVTSVFQAASPTEAVSVFSVPAYWRGVFAEIYEKTTVTTSSGQITSLAAKLQGLSSTDVEPTWFYLMGATAAGYATYDISGFSSAATESGTQSISLLLSVANSAPGNLGTGSASNLTAGVITVKVCGVTIQ